MFWHEGLKGTLRILCLFPTYSKQHQRIHYLEDRMQQNKQTKNNCNVSHVLDMEKRREVLPRCAFSYHCQCKKKKSQIYVCSSVFRFEFTVSVINQEERLQSSYNCMIALIRGLIVHTNTHAVACFLIDNNYLQKIPILSCRPVYVELIQRLKFHSSSKNVAVKDSGVVFGGVRFNAICIQRLDVPDGSAYQQGILTKTVRKSRYTKCSGKVQHSYVPVFINPTTKRPGELCSTLPCRAQSLRVWGYQAVALKSHLIHNVSI